MKRESFFGRLGAAALCLALASAAWADDSASWPMFGQSPLNGASQPAETAISTATVPNLKTVWVDTAAGNVSARPAIVNGVAYFPDWGGKVWAVNAKTGAVIWSHAITDYGFPAGTFSRTSPAVDNGVLFLGTRPGAYLLAINAGSGALIWSTQLDSHPRAWLTAAPVVSNGVVYEGVAGGEEAAVADPAYPCCSFRGSVSAVNASTGAVIWKTWTVPTGYTGGAVFGSHAVIDPGRNRIYVGTGDNYTPPTDPAYLTCLAQGKSTTACLSKADYFDSILALNLTSGAVAWAHRTLSGDAFNDACDFSGPGVGRCPKPKGPDYDFSAGPQEITFALPGGGTRTIIGAGQKSGVYMALNPDTGALIWSRQVGPGSPDGGILWGTATDGQRIYVAIVNRARKAYADAAQFPASGKAGSWNALDPATGAILWRTADPNGARDAAPLSVANGVVFGGSGAGGASQKNMFALNAATGAILWSFASGGTVQGGAAIVDGMVYWGSGYSLNDDTSLTPNNKLFAFGLPGGD